jgi:hypothetical protein
MPKIAATGMPVPRSGVALTVGVDDGAAVEAVVGAAVEAVVGAAVEVVNRPVLMDVNDSLGEVGTAVSLISLVMIGANVGGMAAAREPASSLKFRVSKYELQALKVWRAWVPRVSLASPMGEFFSRITSEGIYTYRPARTKVHQPKLPHGRNPRLHRIENRGLRKGDAQRRIRYITRIRGEAVCRPRDIIRLRSHGIRMASHIISARGQVVRSRGHAHGGALRNVPIVIGVDSCFVREGGPYAEDDGRGDCKHEAGPSKGEDERTLVFLAPAGVRVAGCDGAALFLELRWICRNVLDRREVSIAHNEFGRSPLMKGQQLSVSSDEVAKWRGGYRTRWTLPSIFTALLGRLPRCIAKTG